MKGRNKPFSHQGGDYFKASTDGQAAERLNKANQKDRSLAFFGNWGGSFLASNAH
jgi:hypothetical protein